MLEIRTSGSERGAVNARPYPYSLNVPSGTHWVMLLRITTRGRCEGIEAARR